MTTKPSPHGERQRFEAISAAASTHTAEARAKAVAALLDKSGLVRHEAAFVLGCIGQSEDAGFLLPALSDSSPFVRHEAALALGRIGSPEHISVLTLGLDDQIPEVAMSFEMAIAEIKERIASPRGEAEGLAPALQRVDEVLECESAMCTHCIDVLIEARETLETRATVPADSAREALQSISLEVGLILVQWSSIPEDLRNAISHLKTLASEAQLPNPSYTFDGKLSVPSNGAAEICAEMAREAATQATKYDSPYAELGEMTRLMSERYHGMSDALREAERRIRTTVNTRGEERRAIAQWVKGLVSAGIMFTQTVKVSDKQTQLQPVSADYVIDLTVAASSATGEKGNDD